MIRLATLADAGAVMELRNDPIARYWSLDDQPREMDEVAEWIAAGHHSPSRGGVWVYCEDDRIIGYGRLEVRGEDGTLSYVVLPRYRHQGYGSQIVSRLIEQARARGCRVVRVLANLNNVASEALARRFGMMRSQAVYVEYWGKA